MNRRTVLKTLGAGALATRIGRAQIPAPSGGLMPGTPEHARTRPMLCGYSGNLAQVEYPFLGEIAGQVGYEGIDLTVMTGGHVDPRLTNVDLIRAFESIRASSLDIPMITTNITALQDPTAYAVMAMTGRSMIHLFRMGYMPVGSIPKQVRMAQAKRALFDVATLARRCDILPMFANRTGGYVGETTAEALQVVSELDSRSAGLFYDVAHATAGDGDIWENALKAALLRIRAVGIQDFRWKKGEGGFELCALGEGLVDWDRFLAALAAAKFLGPFSIQMQYETKDAPGAMARDLEFIRSKVEKAWAKKQDAKS